MQFVPDVQFLVIYSARVLNSDTGIFLSIYGSPDPVYNADRKAREG